LRVKALILNSGAGRRMGEMTLRSCKCMARLDKDTTILDSQLAKLKAAGVAEFVITTGPFAAELEDYVTSRFGGEGFAFVNNPEFASTNYIYSIYLARELLHDDILLLHGDLVFEDSVLRDVLAQDRSVMVTDASLPLPEKDFQAVLKDGCIEKVGVEFFESAVAAQPLYRLARADWEVWLAEISRFCEDGARGVYAENAFNRVSGQVPLYALDAGGRFCGEIDTPEDLARVQEIFKRFRSLK
jgi:phosphoenolpyruvate phosphomutase